MRARLVAPAPVGTTFSLVFARRRRYDFFRSLAQLMSLAAPLPVTKPGAADSQRGRAKKERPGRAEQARGRA
jgi:hypothetical protein